ncbi:hypothetical protein H312_01772 [Anncaliia algerae PRA339]|uniref:Uncharacterized protein n=1 Tax=Anncaliia algerae PRA339 TaxID=1288291 RepID=A0A059F1D7_9MICR|nr:hypothetical protein H312_01772 [Anncaliia algerae PRA339]
MDTLYKELENEFIDKINNFLKDEITTEELIEEAKAFDLIFKLNDKKYLERMKEEIFNFYINEYKYALEVDRMHRKYNEGIILDVDIEKILSQAKRIGAIRVNPYGMEDSKNFSAPYPIPEETNEYE